MYKLASSPPITKSFYHHWSTTPRITQTIIVITYYLRIYWSKFHERCAQKRLTNRHDPKFSNGRTSSTSTRCQRDLLYRPLRFCTGWRFDQQISLAVRMKDMLGFILYFYRGTVLVRLKHMIYVTSIKFLTFHRYFYVLKKSRILYKNMLA